MGEDAIPVAFVCGERGLGNEVEREGRRRTCLLLLLCDCFCLSGYIYIYIYIYHLGEKKKNY